LIDPQDIGYYLVAQSHGIPCRLFCNLLLLYKDATWTSTVTTCPHPGNLVALVSRPCPRKYRRLASAAPKPRPLPPSPYGQTLASTVGISPYMRLPKRSSMRRWRNTQIAGWRACGMEGRAHETPSPRCRGKCEVLTLVVERRRRDLDMVIDC
jgi:hypothetical protein